MQLKKSCYKIGKYVERNSASILTGLGIAGVAVTTIMGIKATPKALQVLDEREEYKQEIHNEPLTKFEKALVLTPVYLPTIIMGATTMSCIYGANYINKQQQAVLSGALAYLNNSYNDYRNKVNELYGPDADGKVKSEIAKDLYLKQNNEEDPDKKLLYDEFSGRYFNFDVSKLTETLYEINRAYNFMGDMKLNDVYEFLGLEKTDYGETVGWCSIKDWECNGFSWIDISLQPIKMADNLECYAIIFNVDPHDDYLQWANQEPF